MDSSVWSIVLRRRSRNRNAREQALYYEWRERVIAGEAAIMGLIRQEVLSGIEFKERFETIRGQLDAVHELRVGNGVWDQAARFYTICKGRGGGAWGCGHDDLRRSVCEWVPNIHPGS